jgi:hypothetical protein
VVEIGAGDVVTIAPGTAHTGYGTSGYGSPWYRPTCRSVFEGAWAGSTSGSDVIVIAVEAPAHAVNEFVLRPGQYGWMSWDADVDLGRTFAVYNDDCELLDTVTLPPHTAGIEVDSRQRVSISEAEDLTFPGTNLWRPDSSCR